MLSEVGCSPQDTTEGAQLAASGVLPNHLTASVSGRDVLNTTLST